MSRCKGHGRHWFTVYGKPGLRAPFCQRYPCREPNPKPLTRDEVIEYGSAVAAARLRIHQASGATQAYLSAAVPESSDDAR